MSVEYVEKVYNRTARFYDRIFGPFFRSGREIAPQLLELYPGAQLLEVGIGTGLSLPALPKNIEITGIDLSQRMLDVAQKRLEKENFRHVKLKRMDATHLEFPNASFDRVLAAYFISTVPDPVRVIQEMKRVCKPGGYLVFLNHFRNELPVLGSVEKLLSPLFYRIGFRTDLDVHNLMEECGLEIETLEPIDFLGHWKAVRCINPA
ncbi:MAG TPA: methyltransferase domain-containing protein [Acidobacteriota bacterium]|nr:methyltransferase domain-containing protein [Acidobacteriota bacterium]